MEITVAIIGSLLLLAVAADASGSGGWRESKRARSWISDSPSASTADLRGAACATILDLRPADFASLCSRKAGFWRCTSESARLPSPYQLSAPVFLISAIGPFRSVPLAPPSFPVLVERLYIRSSPRPVPVFPLPSEKDSLPWSPCPVRPPPSIARANRAPRPFIA
jgi:hypothetical protein